MKNLCLNYHDFSGTRARTFMRSKYTVDFKEFKLQLEILSNYKNIPLVNLLPHSSVPDFSYSLTFDDGLKSNLYVAEELAKRNLKGTFFIIKNESLSNDKYLNVNEIKEIDKLGMEIGSHSCTHQHLNRLDRKNMIKELHDSKLFLEDILSKKIVSIAYPGGHFGFREIQESFKEGFLLNRTCIIGLNNLPLNNGIIKCITITDKINLDTFKDISHLSPFFFAKKKAREIALIIPKYFESKILSWKH